MGQVLFIVWRECVEALLVVGILHAWLSLGGDASKRGLSYLWGGVLAGVVIALLLAWSLTAVGDALSGNAQTYFQIVMLLAAAILIVQMVFWMRSQSRTLKKNLHARLDQSSATGHWWGVFMLALLAVAREGSEMAVFLYGICVSQHVSVATMLFAGGIGVLMAYATFYILQMSGKKMSWRFFFGITEVLLLCLAAGLMLSGVERVLDMLLETSDTLMASTWAMALTEQVWDSSFLVADNTGWGNFLATVVGYRARPTWCNVLTMLFYWSVIGVLMLRSTLHKPVLLRQQRT